MRSRRLTPPSQKLLISCRPADCCAGSRFRVLLTKPFACPRVLKGYLSSSIVSWRPRLTFDPEGLPSVLSCFFATLGGRARDHTRRQLASRGRPRHHPRTVTAWPVVHYGFSLRPKARFSPALGPAPSLQSALPLAPGHLAPHGTASPHPIQVTDGREREALAPASRTPTCRGEEGHVPAGRSVPAWFPGGQTGPRDTASALYPVRRASLCDFREPSRAGPGNTPHRAGRLQNEEGRRVGKNPSRAPLHPYVAAQV